MEEKIHAETCTISYQGGRNKEVIFCIMEFLSRLIEMTTPGLTKTFVCPKK